MATQDNQLVEDISGLLNIIVSDAAKLAESVPDPVAYLGALPLCLHRSYHFQKQLQGLVQLSLCRLARKYSFWTVLWPNTQCSARVHWKNNVLSVTVIGFITEQCGFTGCLLLCCRKEAGLWLLDTTRQARPETEERHNTCYPVGCTGANASHACNLSCTLNLQIQNTLHTNAAIAQKVRVLWHASSIESVLLH